MQNKIVVAIITMMLFIAALYAVYAVVPLGPGTFTNSTTEKQSEAAYPAGVHGAYAGNITKIDIYGITQTKHWQGYYGDITGTIVLDDASNYTLYDWPNPEPKGEIYATPNASTPRWPNMACFDFVAGAGGGLGNVTQWENFFNMTYNDVDGLDETFNMTRHEAIDIGDVVTILNSTCPSTFMHQNDTFQETRFSEVLLEDDQGRIVFTTIIENKDNSNNTDIQGFKGSPFTPDFQMIVAEDGTSRTGGQINRVFTPYYFYIDLE
ncbi:MAG: hypothetical protein ABIJ34_03035 [archaeon]